MGISLYLFTGFLESGKSTLISRMLQSGQLCKESKSTLLILCEEGDAKYSYEFLEKHNLHVEIIYHQKQYTADYLMQLQKKYDCTDVIVEYNGFWSCSEVYYELPEEWIVKEKFFCADAETIGIYSSNLKMQTDDKIRYSSVVIFNRVSFKTDISVYHKLVRRNSRRARIFYEFSDGSWKEDLAFDDPPYDINSPVIDLPDFFVAQWMYDLRQRPAFYVDRTVRFRGLFQQIGEALVFGRNVTFVVERDAKFWGIPCDMKNAFEPEIGEWYTITADIVDRQDKKQPGLSIISCEKAYPPAQPVVVLH